MTKYYKHEENTKSRIKSALTELLKETKLENISMADVAKYANLSKPTVYKYYISVESVFDDLLKDEKMKFLKANHSFIPTNPENVTAVIKYFRNDEYKKKSLRSDILKMKLIEAFATEILSDMENKYIPDYSQSNKEFIFESISWLVAYTIVYYIIHDDEDISNISEYIDKIIQSMVSQ